MERKAKLGGWTVGTYPFGYRKLDGVVGPAPDPAAAPIVREIFERYTQDRAGSAAIANDLNARGIRTRYGRDWSRTAVLGRPPQPGVSRRGPPFRGVWYEEVTSLSSSKPRSMPLRRSWSAAQLSRGCDEPTGRTTCSRDWRSCVTGAPHPNRRQRQRSPRKRYAYYTCYPSRYGTSHVTRPGCLRTSWKRRS